MILCVGAAGLLQNNEKQFLIAQRPSGKFMEGFWEFPGGKIEHEETPEMALQRELYEEIDVQVNIKDMRPFYFISAGYPNYHALFPIFYVSKWVGIPIGKEGQNIRWVTIQEMDSVDFLPANKDTIEKIKATSSF